MTRPKVVYTLVITALIVETQCETAREATVAILAVAVGNCLLWAWDDWRSRSAPPRTENP